jgi:hypothetical protein
VEAPINRSRANLITAISGNHHHSTLLPCYLSPHYWRGHHPLCDAIDIEGKRKFCCAGSILQPFNSRPWMTIHVPRNVPESPARGAGRGSKNVMAFRFVPIAQMQGRLVSSRRLPSRNIRGMPKVRFARLQTNVCSGPNQALLERISFLEAQLAAYANEIPPEKRDPSQEHLDSKHLVSLTSSKEERKSNIADIVGFLSLGGEAAYVGSSSGFSLATNLGQMVQATVWNKALASTVSQTQPKSISIADLKRNSAGPPNDGMGGRILDAYFMRVHLRYPFLDRKDILERHANRFTQDNRSPQDQYGTFKMYMIYAIGATMLKLTEQYDYTPPENFFMTALQYISAARESHSVHNIEAMTLLVLYNLRSPSNSGIWYMMGLAMRTCVDLGLHREAHYGNVPPYEGQLRRRLFWTVYFLERVIAVSLGRPYSIADRDIDASLPLEIDDTVRDDGLIARTLAVSPSPTFQASRPSSNITLGIQCIRLKRLESHIQGKIYRVDRPITSLVSKISPILRLLEDWHRALPPSTPYESDYLNMHYYKAVRLLLQPFLMILPPTDQRISLCLQASGQICQIFKRLHQRDSYGHSFVALHSVFIAGVTMWYILCFLMYSSFISNTP